MLAIVRQRIVLSWRSNRLVGALQHGPAVGSLDPRSENLSAPGKALYRRDVFPLVGRIVQHEPTAKVHPFVVDKTFQTA